MIVLQIYVQWCSNKGKCLVLWKTILGPYLGICEWLPLSIRHLSDRYILIYITWGNRTWIICPKSKIGQISNIVLEIIPMLCTYDLANFFHYCFDSIIIRSCKPTFIWNEIIHRICRLTGFCLKYSIIPNGIPIWWWFYKLSRITKTEDVFYTISICSILTPVSPNDRFLRECPVCRLICGSLTSWPYPLFSFTFNILNTLWIIKPLCWFSIFWIYISIMFKVTVWIGALNTLKECTYSIIWCWWTIIFRELWFILTQTVYKLNCTTIGTRLTLFTSHPEWCWPRNVSTILCEQTRTQIRDLSSLSRYTVVRICPRWSKFKSRLVCGETAIICTIPPTTLWSINRCSFWNTTIDNEDSGLHIVFCPDSRCSKTIPFPFTLWIRMWFTDRNPLKWICQISTSWVICPVWTCISTNYAETKLIVPKFIKLC